MNETETLQTLPFVANAPKLTAGGGEVIASEVAEYVQTEAEVGSEVLSQETGV